MDFEWNDGKSAYNERRHGIDFREASKIFDGRHIAVLESPRGGEIRWIAIGEYRDKIWAVVFTIREENIRIISARTARKDEKERYYRSLLGRRD